MVLFSCVLFTYLLEVSSFFQQWTLDQLVRGLVHIFLFCFCNPKLLGAGNLDPKGMNLRMQDTLFEELILTVNRGCLTVE